MPSHVAVIASDATEARTLLGAIPSEPSRSVVLLGAQADGAGGLDAAQVHVFPSAAIDGDTQALAAFVTAAVPAGAVLALPSAQWARDIAGWLTVTHDVPLVWAVEQVEIDGSTLVARRGVLGGAGRLVHEVDSDRGCVLLMDPVPAAADAATEAAPSVVVSHDAPGPGRTQIVAAEPAAQGAVSLQGARIVVTVGRGIGGPDNLPVFRELADTLGAALGASRVVVDAGWLPFAHQVGQTGSTVAPDLYLAFGVSGAIQHLAGMRGSKRVIAVNLDSEAPLCRAADLVVPEDATEFAVRLLAAARQAGTPANAHGVAPEERPFSKTSADVVAVGVEQ